MKECVEWEYIYTNKRKEKEKEKRKEKREREKSFKRQRKKYQKVLKGNHYPNRACDLQECLLHRKTLRQGLDQAVYECYKYW